MGKVFIDCFECKTKHWIFTGKNALMHAAFFIEKGRVCGDADELYRSRFKAEKSCSWHKGNGSFISKEVVDGCGVHMKCYELKDHIIYASQNDVASPLFEFAIVYEKRPKLLEFFHRSFNRAKTFSVWWKANNYYGIRGKKNEAH